MDRTVAIKVLPSHLAADAERRRRFEQEARAASALNHPHICTLYDIGSEGETSYLVMEYLDGETLATRLARGPLRLPDVLTLGSEIAEALAAAHKQGIVHRDLKPANVMLTKAGVKLLNFGLAKRCGHKRSEWDGSVTLYEDWNLSSAGWHSLNRDPASTGRRASSEPRDTF